MSGRILLVLPAVLAKTEDGLSIDTDLAEGIRLYLENFDEVRIASPIISDIRDFRLATDGLDL